LRAGDDRRRPVAGVARCEAADFRRACRRSQPATATDRGQPAARV